MWSKDIKYINRSWLLIVYRSIDEYGEILPINSDRSLLWKLHSVRKCTSSSIAFSVQWRQIILSISISSCLPVYIRNLLELTKSLAMCIPDCLFVTHLR